MRFSLVLLAACSLPAEPQIMAVDVWPPLSSTQPPGLKEIVLKDASGSVVLRDGSERVEVPSSPLGSALLVGPLTVSKNHSYELLLNGIFFGMLRVGDDDGPPPKWLGDPVFSFSDDTLLLQRQVNRPCRLMGVPGLWLADPYAGDVRVAVQPNTDYALVLTCRDPTARETEQWLVSFHTLPRQALLLNELVVDPKQDWNDSGSTRTDIGVPFDALVDPDSKPSSTDEWVELFNAGEDAVDASLYSLVVDDRDHSELLIGETQVYGDLVVEAGDYLVARLSPPGKNATNSARIRLIDFLGSVRDAIQLGTDAPNGAATSASDEAIAHCGRQWRKQRATPGRKNPCRAETD